MPGWVYSGSMEMVTDPHFSSEAQETFTKGSRVYVTAEPNVARPVGKGAEGEYVGRYGRLAVVDFDTPSGEPWRLALDFDSIRNLYR